MNNSPVGYVIRVFGDIALVGVDDEGLRRIGLRGKYVKIETKSGESLIGIVSNLNLSDELYRQSGGRLEILRGFDDLTLVRSEVIVSILGTIQDNNVERRVLSTPAPGDKVYELDSELLNSVFSKGEVPIGVLNTQRDVHVSLELNELASKHLAILAMTGSGKSNALGVLLLQILRKFTDPRILLIDTHSEYISMKSIDELAEKVNIYAPRGKLRDALLDLGISVIDLEIPYWLLTIEEWYSIIGLDARATRQRRVFRTVLRDVKESKFPNAALNDPIYFDLEELKGLLERVRDGDEVLMKLEDALENEEYSFIFWPEHSLALKDDAEKLFEFVSKPLLNKGLNIISLGGLASDIQNVVASMLLRLLFRISIEAKLKRKPLPIMVAIEEAHVYAPDYWTPSKGILEKIAKEGRKFGIGLIVISQRPRELSQTLLAQCGTLFALRTVNPSDQTHIQRSMEDVTQTVLSSLPSLGRGEAVISGPSVPIPCIVKIDHFDALTERLYNKRVSLGGKDVDFSKEWNREISVEELKEILKNIYTIRGKDVARTGSSESKSTLDTFFG
ncbi:MAG: ATP-binding protein [Candidatus Njordarchaeia archaeon]